MSICQPIAAMTLPAVPLAFGYYLQPRIFSFASNLLSVGIFAFLLYRLRLGYKLALSGAYVEYSGETSGSKQRQTIAAASSPLIRPMLHADVGAASSSSSSPPPAPLLNFPLVFPLYYKYLLVLLCLLSLQLLLSLFAPNSPSFGPAVFLLSMLVYTCFHACEQGLLTFLTQRSIGSGAIRRSIVWGSAWGVVVLLAVVVAADLDRQRDSAATANSGQHGNSSAPTGVLPRLRDAPRGVTQAAAAWTLPVSPLTAEVLGNVSGGGVTDVVSTTDDWRGGSWFDVSGSVLVVDTATADLLYTYLAAALCDCCLLLYYLLLLIIRIRCLRIMPWLSSRVSAFSLARFLFLRRLLSLLSLLLFLLTSSSASTYCLNIALQAYMPVYGVAFYLFLVWDSRFWRKLEYITNGPYPAYRSLDDTGRRNSEVKGAADDAAAASCTSPPLSSADASSSSSASASIAPLLKLPRHGLPNLVPILHHHMVDFSELSISSSQPLALGRPDTAVYAALYRGQPVAVKRLHCDVLTVELIEREVGEARLMSVLHHRYVVRFIGVCIRPPCVCLVSELCEGGSLSEWVQQRRREMEEEEEQLRQQQEEDDSDLSVTVDRSRAAAGLVVPEAAIAEESDSCDESAAQQAASSSFLSSSLDLSSSSSFPLSTILSFSLDACCALTYLHSFSPPIIHRDIKSSNFVLSPIASSPPSPTSSSSSASTSAASTSSPQYRLLLIDFGESRRFHWLEAGLERRREERGTISWMAPELLRDVKVAEHVKSVLGRDAVKKERLSEAELHRLLQSVGVTPEEAEVECWREGKDNEEEWEEIIQATLSLSTASFASNSSSLISSSAPSPSGPANALSASFSSPSSSRFSSSSSSSFLSRSFFASSSRYSEKVDIYGLSMLLWSMLALRPHPFARIPSFLLPFLVTGGVRPRCPPHTPPLLMRLMRTAWHPDPRRRPSAMQLMDRLECVQYQLAGNRGEEVLREQMERRKDVGGGENGGRGVKAGRPGREREAERDRERAERERDWERERTQSPPVGRRRTPQQPQRALSSYGLPPLITPSSSFPSSQSATAGLPAFVISASAPSSQPAVTPPMLSSPTAAPAAAARAADMRTIRQEPEEEEDDVAEEEKEDDGAAQAAADETVEHKVDAQQPDIEEREQGVDAESEAASAASLHDAVE